LSEELANDYIKKLNSSESFKEGIAMRSQLPVFKKKNDILDLIRKNSIVIIQGSTGCGKTTQVSYDLYWKIFCFNIFYSYLYIS